MLDASCAELDYDNEEDVQLDGVAYGTRQLVYQQADNL